jgi:hypothetical protein
VILFFSSPHSVSLTSRNFITFYSFLIFLGSSQMQLSAKCRDFPHFSTFFPNFCPFWARTNSYKPKTFLSGLPMKAHHLFTILNSCWRLAVPIVDFALYRLFHTDLQLPHGVDLSLRRHALEIPSSDIMTRSVGEKHPQTGMAVVGSD